jgi:hypothetical protein
VSPPSARERLAAALDADPADAATRQALADLVREADDPLAADCHVWLARAGKYPDPPTRPTAGGPFAADDGEAYWGWCDYDGLSAKGSRARHATLPPPLWNRLTEVLDPDRLATSRYGGVAAHLGRHRILGWRRRAWLYFDSRADAEAALVIAWKTLSPAERPTA